MKIIFLDVDGCLNWDHTKARCNGFLGIDKIRVKRLARIVEATGAVIVLTSTWGTWFEVGAYKQTDKSAKYLSNKLRAQSLKVYDTIDYRNFRHNGRASAIQNYLAQQEHFVENYVILDDEMFWGYEVPPLKNHLVYCISDVFRHDELSGLTDNLVQHAINILNGEEEGICVDEDAQAVLKENADKVVEYYDNKSLFDD